MYCTSCRTEAFDFGMLSITLYRSYKGFGYALGISAAPEETRLSKSRIREETDAGAEAMGRGSSLTPVFLLLAGVPKRKRDIRRRGTTCVAIDGRMGGLRRFTCTPAFTVS